VRYARVQKLNQFCKTLEEICKVKMKKDKKIITKESSFKQPKHQKLSNGILKKSKSYHRQEEQHIFSVDYVKDHKFMARFREENRQLSRQCWSG